jgi:hypothetical protein
MLFHSYNQPQSIQWAGAFISHATSELEENGSAQAPVLRLGQERQLF